MTLQPEEKRPQRKLNKKKRQRNIQQVKQHDKNPLSQRKEEKFTLKRIKNNNSKK